MYVLKLKKVDCRDCVPKIESSLLRVDSDAEVGVDLLGSSVRVQSKLPLSEIISALNKDGFTVEATATH